MMLNCEDEYIPICDNSGNYLFCAYEDKKYNSINTQIWNLMSITIDPELMVPYKELTLVSCNEIAYYLYFFFTQNKCKVFVKGEIWESILPNAPKTDNVKGFGIYVEGNPGLSLNELGFWRTTIPYGEFSFLETLYQTVKKENKLYKKEWLDKNTCNRELYRLIKSGVPLMVARLGNTEAMVVQESLYSASSRLWTEWLYTTAGFFSANNYSIEDIDMYSKLTIEAIKNCDLHCCRFENQIGILNHFAAPSSKYIDWYDLYSRFDKDNCWLHALTGKKVLVISSACKTIQYQYENNRTQLFSSPDILPTMDLFFYQSIETQMGDKKGYDSWFKAYNDMIDNIREIDFDIALIAAGAYGYLLASDIKKMGKQAIELCSGIYPVFGIKVKTQQTIREISQMYNKHWIFPKETPPDYYMKIEKGSYWE